MNQADFERLRMLVIQHGEKADVDALHDLCEAYNRHLAAAPRSGDA